MTTSAQLQIVCNFDDSSEKCSSSFLLQKKRTKGSASTRLAASSSPFRTIGTGQPAEPAPAALALAASRAPANTLSPPRKSYNKA